MGSEPQLGGCGHAIGQQDNYSAPFQIVDDPDASVMTTLATLDHQFQQP